MRAPTYQSLPALSDACPLSFKAHKHTDASQNVVHLWHEALEIKRFFSAGTKLIIGDEVFFSEVGDVFVISPLIPHSTSDESSSNDYHMLDIDLARLPVIPGSKTADTLAAIQRGDVVFKSRIPRDEVLTNRIEALIDCLESGADPAGLAVLGHVFFLLDYLVERAAVPAEVRLSTEEILSLNRKLAPALSLIQAEYRRHLTLDELADVCGLNKRYFCRLFRERTGTTAVTYINRLRTYNAGLLLRTTDAPVGEILERCGFSSREYFFRVFREMKGCTPLEYRGKGESEV